MSDYIFNENELTVAPQKKGKEVLEAILGALAIVAFVSSLLLLAATTLKT